MKHWLALLVLTLVVLAFGPVAAQDQVTLTVDAGTLLGPISPYVYGSNLGTYSVIPMDLMDEAQALNLRFMRLGGDISDEQNLRFPTLDFFVLQTRAAGAEPAVTVRLFNGTPEHAADVVRYANVTKGYNIRYWSIGNEPNLYRTPSGSPPYTTENHNREWRAIAEAMLEVDPDILFIGPDITQYVVLDYEDGNIEYLDRSFGGQPVDANGRDWMIEFLRANGDLVDVVAIHRYPYPGAGQSAAATATVEGLRENVHQWDVMIANLREIVRDVTGGDLPLAVTEFNSNSSPSSGAEASLDSLYNALWTADVLGRLIKQGVEIAAFWDMQGVGARNWGLLTQNGVRPVYYAYLLYTHFGTELVQSASSDPHVSVYSALADDGALTLMVINLGDEDANLALDLSGFTPDGDADAWRLDASHNAEAIESVALADGSTFSVPGRSATLYRLTGTP